MSTLMTGKVRDILTEEEFQSVLEKDNLKAASIVAFDWGVIIALFTLAAMYPNPLVLLAVIILLGGRQMAFGVLVHETGHKSFFTSPAVNHRAFLNRQGLLGSGQFQHQRRRVVCL